MSERCRSKLAIVTGAAGGLGYETALGLARLGATTNLARRNADKGAQALARIRRERPAAKVGSEILDLASLASVGRLAAAVIAAQRGVIDILVNDADIMGLPSRQVTEDGIERQIGVNYLGHFALTARLKEALCSAPAGGRVVNLASWGTGAPASISMICKQRDPDARVWPQQASVIPDICG